jgi:hypothetical protein
MRSGWRELLGERRDERENDWLFFPSAPGTHARFLPSPDSVMATVIRVQSIAPDLLHRAAHPCTDYMGLMIAHPFGKESGQT